MVGGVWHALVVVCHLRHGATRPNNGRDLSASISAGVRTEKMLSCMQHRPRNHTKGSRPLSSPYQTMLALAHPARTHRVASESVSVLTKDLLRCCRGSPLLLLCTWSQLS